MSRFVSKKYLYLCVAATLSEEDRHRVECVYSNYTYAKSHQLFEVLTSLKGALQIVEIGRRWKLRIEREWD
jgi:hypothetical protein